MLLQNKQLDEKNKDLSTKNFNLIIENNKKISSEKKLNSINLHIEKVLKKIESKK